MSDSKDARDTAAKARLTRIAKRLWIGLGIMFLALVLLVILIASIGAPKQAAQPAAPPEQPPQQKWAGPAEGELSVFSKNPVIAEWAQVTMAAVGCEYAYQRARGQITKFSNGEAAGSDAYRVTREAHDQCVEADDDIRQLEPPAQYNLRGAEQICAKAFKARAAQLETVLTLIDGEDRPSMINQAVDMMKDADLQRRQCVEAFQASAKLAGIVLPEPKLGPAM